MSSHCLWFYFKLFRLAIIIIKKIYSDLDEKVLSLTFSVLLVLVNANGWNKVESSVSRFSERNIWHWICNSWSCFFDSKLNHKSFFFNSNNLILHYWMFGCTKILETFFWRILFATCNYFYQFFYWLH